MLPSPPHMHGFHSWVGRSWQGPAGRSCSGFWCWTCAPCCSWLLSVASALCAGWGRICRPAGGICFVCKPQYYLLNSLCSDALFFFWKWKSFINLLKNNTCCSGRRGSPAWAKLPSILTEPKNSKGKKLGVWRGLILMAVGIRLSNFPLPASCAFLVLPPGFPSLLYKLSVLTLMWLTPFSLWRCSNSFFSTGRNSVGGSLVTGRCLIITC